MTRDAIRRLRDYVGENCSEMTRPCYHAIATQLNVMLDDADQFPCTPDVEDEVIRTCHTALEKLSMTRHELRQVLRLAVAYMEAVSARERSST